MQILNFHFNVIFTFRIETVRLLSLINQPVTFHTAPGFLVSVQKCKFWLFIQKHRSILYLGIENRSRNLEKVEKRFSIWMMACQLKWAIFIWATFVIRARFFVFVSGLPSLSFTSMVESHQPPSSSQTKDSKPLLSIRLHSSTQFGP